MNGNRAQAEARLLVGSYTRSLPHVEAHGEGITLLALDLETGVARPVARFGELVNPSYLALTRDDARVYAIEEMAEADGASVATLRLDPDSGFAPLGKTPSLGDWPCHLALDEAGRRLFVANYMSGSLVCHQLDAAGLPVAATKVQRSGSGPNPDRQEGPHVHQAMLSPDGDSVLICDAGTDAVVRHRLTASSFDPQPDLVLPSPGGSFPRHMAFSTDGDRLFVVHELGGFVRAYRHGAAGVDLIGDTATLPPDYSGVISCAAIKAHPSGRFLYASNRGHDSIVAFDISDAASAPRVIGWFPVRGRTPRDFAIAPSGRHLVAVNQDSSSLSLFAIDQESGSLTPIGEPQPVGSPVCVLFAD